MDFISLQMVTAACFAALGLLSVTALATVIFKVQQFRRMGVGRRRTADAVLSHWLGGQPDEAARLAGRRDTVLTRVLAAVLSGLRAGDPVYAEQLARQSALIELSALNTRMRLLEAVVQAAPMLGLLGTVIGMIDAFGALSQGQQAMDASELARGIWTALTTTAIGLAIALATYFVAGWLEARIERETSDMEITMSAAIHGRTQDAARR